MTPRGGIRPGAGRPRVGREVKISIRESDEARATDRGQTLAARVRLGLDVLGAVEDGETLATVREMINGPKQGVRQGR